MRILALILCLVASTANAGNFQELIDTIGAPTLAGDAHTVEDVTFTYGHATFTFSGVVEGVLAAGQDVGYAFSGEGKIAVEIQDGPFHQANLTTLEEYGHKGTGLYTESFEQALLLSSSPREALASGEHSTDVSLSEVLSMSLERWQASWHTGLDHELANAIFNKLPGEELLAFLWGGDDETVYLLDTVTEMYEALAHWEKNTFFVPNFSFLDNLIYQPVGIRLKDRPVPPILQTDIDVELVSSDNLNMKQKTTTQLTSLRNGVQVVTFSYLNGRPTPDFNPFVRTKFQKWDKRDDKLSVTSVKTKAGLPLEFSHKYDELMVKLPKILVAGEQIDLVIEAEGLFLKNYAGDDYLVLGNMPWFPQLDINSVRAPFHSVVKVAKPYVPLGCGVNVRRWEEGNLNCLETREEKAMAFPMLVIGDFEVAEKKTDRFDLKVYSYKTPKARGAKALLRNGLAVLDYYSNGMEPFPYKELEVVEIPYYRHFFWQAPAGIVEITSEGLSPISGDTSDIEYYIKQGARQGQNARYAHEIAHQWWGNLVSWGTTYDNWLSESFAEYLSYMFMSEGAKEKRKAKEQLKSWKIAAEECTEKSSIYGAVALGGSNRNRQCTTALWYDKGPLVLHALRQEVGDQNFKKWLYFITTQAAKKDIKVITEDVILILNAVTKKDYRPWFDKYVFGTEMPKVKIK